MSFEQGAMRLRLAELQLGIRKSGARTRTRKLGTYGFAVLMAAGGIALRIALRPALGNDTPILLPIIGVALAAWVGGFGPGLLATLITVCADALLFVHPFGNESHIEFVQIVRLTLFCITGLIVSLLTEALDQTMGAWKRAEQMQENRVLQERNRIAREIHDTLAQGLTGIILQLEAAQAAAGEINGDASGHVGSASQIARNCLQEARRSVHALRPGILDDLDICKALRHYSELLTNGTPIEAQITMNDNRIPEWLTEETQADLLRIALESITNAIKHANCTRIMIDASMGQDVVSITVADNGSGFSPEVMSKNRGFGLTSIYERAERVGARILLSTERGVGTRITVKLASPLAKDRTGSPCKLQ